MDRPNQHEIELKSRKLLIGNLPSGWEYRESSRDYGIDFEIEMFSNNKSTGVVFKLQLKGSESINILSDNATISFTFPIKNLKYYLFEIKIPVIIMVCDVTWNKIYWLDVHSNYQLIKTVKEVNSSQETLNIHIPIKNIFPETHKELLEKVQQSYQKINMENTLEMNPIDFALFADKYFDIDEVIKNSKEKINLLHLNKISSLIKDKNYDQSIQKANELINDSSNDVKIKVTALLALDNVHAIKSNLENDNISERFIIANKIKTITKKSGLNFRLISSVHSETLKLLYLVNKEYSLYLNNKLTNESDDNYWKLTINLTRQILTKKIIRKINKILKILNIAIKNNELLTYSFLLSKLIMNSSAFLMRLEQESLKSFANKIRNTFEIYIDYAIKISTSLKIDDEIISNGLIKMSLYMCSDNSVKEQKKSEIIDFFEKKLSSNVKADAIDMINQIPDVDLNLMNTEPEEEFSIEEETNLYLRMIESLGINLNSNNEISNLIKIGLKDLNPERVLKKCVNLFVSLSNCGIIAERLKLPTAGLKKIHCIKFNHLIEGLSLDNIYEMFKHSHCDNCNDNIKQSPEWKWTKKWQRNENTKHFHLL